MGIAPKTSLKAVKQHRKYTKLNNQLGRSRRPGGTQTDTSLQNPLHRPAQSGTMGHRRLRQFGLPRIAAKR